MSATTRVQHGVISVEKDPSSGDLIATAIPILGYVLYAPEFDVVYKGHIYANEADARAALEKVVWHNRDHYQVKPITFVEAWRAP